ncbi:MAG: carboxypeptidase regulatory-like domain-containing protein [Gemmatimonadetes bacterium]|nr:carboxypeptidase regulatory-like domain-containing protein [Gemmatimonadota bacterium]
MCLIGACVALGIGAGGARNEVAGQSELGAIEGLVLDMQGLVPIAQALVVLNGGLYQTLTNAGGEYVLDSVPPGEYEISVRRIGYEEVVAERVTIEAAMRRRMDFALERAAISLEEIQIRAARRTTPDATRSASVLRSEDLPDQGDILSALQGRIPGLRISGRHDDMRVRLRGGIAEPMFVINGVVARPPLRFYIGASEVECVEVRRGQQAVIEFRSSAQTDVYNGVILIWTKDSGRQMTGACSR